MQGLLHCITVETKPAECRIQFLHLVNIRITFKVKCDQICPFSPSVQLNLKYYNFQEEGKEDFTEAIRTLYWAKIFTTGSFPPSVSTKRFCVTLLFFIWFLPLGETYPFTPNLSQWEMQPCSSEVHLFNIWTGWRPTSLISCLLQNLISRTGRLTVVSPVCPQLKSGGGGRRRGGQRHRGKGLNAAPISTAVPAGAAGTA